KLLHTKVGISEVWLRDSLNQALEDAIMYSKLFIDNEFSPESLGFPTSEEEGPQGSNSCGPKSSQKKESPTKRRRQKHRKQKKKAGEEGTSQGCKTLAKPVKEKNREPKTKKVFVNVYLPNKNTKVPSFVFRTLNLGANFSLCSIPTQASITKTW